MIIYPEHLLLVRGKLSCRSLYGNLQLASNHLIYLLLTHFKSQKNSVGLGTETNCCWSLLYSLQSIFHLMQSSLRREYSVIWVISVSELDRDRKTRAFVMDRRYSPWWMEVRGPWAATELTRTRTRFKVTWNMLTNCLQTTEFSSSSHTMRSSPHDSRPELQVSCSFWKIRYIASKLNFPQLPFWWGLMRFGGLQSWIDRIESISRLTLSFGVHGSW